jgi:hypothetical protein
VRVWLAGPVIAWCTADSASNRSLRQHRVHALQISEMFQGSAPGEQGYGPDADERCCFTVRAKHCTLALEAPDRETRQLWWLELKRFMGVVAAIVDEHQALASTADSTWQAPATSAALPTITQDDIDGDTLVDLPDERHVELPPRSQQLFTYADAPPAAMVAGANAIRAELAAVSERMNRHAAPVYADALAKERAQDHRARAQYLMQQRQLAMRNKHHQPPAFAPPNTASQAWFQTARDFKLGVRVTAASAEQARQALGVPAQSEFSAVSTLDPYAPANTAMRQIPELPASVHFAEYAPTVFARLRLHWGVPLSVYISELGSEEVFIRMVLKGDKKQSPETHRVAWFSLNSQFKVESVTEREATFFLGWLTHYYTHMTDPQADSLLPRFAGLYKLTSREHPRGRFFLVSRNLYAGHCALLCRYHLTGAQPFDGASDAEKLAFIPVLRDQDMVNRKSYLYLRPQQLKTFILQLRRDMQLLAKVNAIGYRFSVGVHDTDVQAPHPADIVKLSQRYGLDRGERELVAMDHYVARMSAEDAELREELLEALPSVEVYAVDSAAKGSLWTQHEGVTVSAKWQTMHQMSVPGSQYYFLQFEDVLHEFDSKMSWELWWKRKEPGVEFIDPAQYAMKMAAFVESRTQCDHPDFRIRDKKARRRMQQQGSANVEAARSLSDEQSSGHSGLSGQDRLDRRYDDTSEMEQEPDSALGDYSTSQYEPSVSVMPAVPLPGLARGQSVRGSSHRATRTSVASERMETPQYGAFGDDYESEAMDEFEHLQL